MRTISTSKQKKMAFIPIVNLLTIFFTLINCIYLRTPIKAWVNLFLYLLIYAFPSAIFWMVVAQLFPSLSTFCSLATSYMSPMLMSIGLIRFQRKYLNV